MPKCTTADGTELHVIDWGTGPTIVFDHGWGLSSLTWEYQMFALSRQGFRCVAFDRRGCGRSDDPGMGHDFDTYADDLATVIASRDLNDVILVGHSAGGGDIVRYLSRHGDNCVAGIVLIAPTTPCVGYREDNPTGLTRDGLLAVMGFALQDKATFATMAAPVFCGMDQPTTECSETQVAWGASIMVDSSLDAMAKLIDAIVTTDFRADCAAVSVPCLVIHGAVDVEPTTLARCGEPTAATIPNAELLVYEHGPHGLFWSHRSRLNADIAAFARACFERNH